MLVIQNPILQSLPSSASSIMYKKNIFLIRHNDIIHEIYKYIVDYLDNENITIKNSDIFFNDVCDYLYTCSHNSYKSMNNAYI